MLRSIQSMACATLLCTLCATSVAADAGGDTAAVELPPVITVAARTAGTFADAPVPASVVTSRDIRKMGASTVGDVLAEQTGLTVIQDHGVGVQMQGLSPDYTLILVDGEPAVGRTAGTLDLARFKVGGLEQVEIVQGPSSSLYGSDALGGVVNIVTRKPIDPFSVSFNSRYGTNNSLETGGTMEAKTGNTGFSVFADRSASDGYDLDPERRGKSAPPYSNYTVQPKVVHDWSENSRLTIAPRFFREDQENSVNFLSEGDTTYARERSTRDDWGLSATVEQGLSQDLDLTLKGYASRYANSTRQTSEADGSTLYTENFGQLYQKGEAALKSELGPHTVLVGGGVVHESVRADYVEGGGHGAASGFAFAQEDWWPARFFNLQASGRVDGHEDYGVNFSPRVAGLVRPFPWMTLKASAGKGFKAPNFQELYLNFTNPQVGYSVFGATGAEAGLERLRAQGQIDTTRPVQDPGDHPLRPENSLSFNAGVELTSGSLVTMRFGGFINHVRDLIESSIIARKTNGQNVYTYFNLHRILTEGAETEATVRPLPWLTFSAGYQFLLTYDLDMLDSIRAQKIYKVGVTGITRPVQRVEYGGLFNRSHNTGNVKVGIDRERQEGFTILLRGLFRDRYGYTDFNHNKILDDDREYARGYALWNFDVTQRLSRFVALRAGVENIANEQAPVPLESTDPSNPVRTVPSLPGRILRAGIEVRYF